MNALMQTFPNFRKWKSDGNSYQEALQNAEIIISEWIDTAKEPGRAIPEPKGKLMYA